MVGHRAKTIIHYFDQVIILILLGDKTTPPWKVFVQGKFGIATAMSGSTDTNPVGMTDVITNDETQKLIDEREFECNASLPTNHSSVLEYLDWNANSFSDHNDGDHEDWKKSLCPKIFDGLLCWDETPANYTAMQACPVYMVGFDASKQAYKRCEENGSWYVDPSLKHPWTNYSKCIDTDDLNFRQNVTRAGDSLSIMSNICLLLGIIIFLILRQLRCLRIKIHIHLFSSLFFSNFSWQLWNQRIISDNNTLIQNTILCQAIHIFTTYFTLSTYSWMLCEGLHLHRLMSFRKGPLKYLYYILIGWGQPFVITSAYVLARLYLFQDTTLCWIMSSNASWIQTIPILVNLISNIGIIFYISIMIKKKLANVREEGIRQSLRAIVFLGPLLGLHYILILYKPEKGPGFEKVYAVFSAIIVNSQGIIVSLVYCFCNQEVITAIKESYRRICERKNLNRRSHEGTNFCETVQIELENH